MAANIITAAEAYTMRNRVRFASNFQEIQDLSKKAVPFSNVYFNITSYPGIIDIEELLKDWVLGDETSATLNASLAAGDPGPSSAGAKTAFGSSENEKTNKVYTGSPEFRRALRQLNETLKEENLKDLRKIKDKHGLSEGEIVAGVGVHLIKKLIGSCTTNKTKSEIDCPCGCKGNVAFSKKMWIGTPDTLHGELDMIAEGVGVAVAEKISIDETEVEGDATDETEVEGDGGTNDEGDGENEDFQRVNLEFKKCVTGNLKMDLCQIISQAIVFGWTEYNLHKELSPYIPTVFIDSIHFGIAVYNPVKDSLILTRDCVPFFSDGPEGKYFGIFILWLVLNHRLFFRQTLDVDYDCRFKEQVDIRIYENLTHYRDCVRDTSVMHKFGTTEGFGILKRKHSEVD